MEQLARGSYEGGGLVARKLRSRLWVERGLFAVVVCAGLVYYGVASRTHRGACMIAIDGQPAVVVASQGAAEHVLSEVKRTAGPLAEAAFTQRVTLHRVSEQGGEVVSEAAAIKQLSSRLTLVTSGVGLYVDGKLLYGFADRGQAVGALTLLLRELSPPDPDLTRTIQGKVKITAGPISSDRFLPSADAALARVRAQMAAREEYEVQPGDSPWKIASAHKLTIAQLKRANPEVDWLRIKRGDRVAIPTGAPPITVIAWKEMDEPVGDPLEGRTQTVRVTYVNGALTDRQVVRRPLRASEVRASLSSAARRRHRSRPEAEAEQPRPHLAATDAEQLPEPRTRARREPGNQARSDTPPARRRDDVPSWQESP